MSTLQNMAIDIVLPEPRTELEAHKRWVNRMQSEYAPLNRYRTKIKVVQL